MEMPAEVMVHNEQLGMKGTRAVLLQIHPDGYYELNVKFGERVHRVMLPVGATAVIAKEPEPVAGPGAEEIER
ncbi:MAG TPA: hypothetical protein VHM02_13720 [Thermoanaerobaculia bacterium]|nr:hypothetical protein [Thermoanaerobaculia bacterium]